MKDEIILYRPDELAEHIEVSIDEKTETIWLTQQQKAELFGTQRSAITKQLGNIFKSGELDENVVSSILEQTTPHGSISFRCFSERFGQKMVCFLQVGKKLHNKYFNRSRLMSKFKI